MKILLLALCLSGCTIIPTQHGKAQFWGDYTNVQFDDGSVHFRATTMRHSGVVRAHWQGASSLGAEAVSGAIGLHSGAALGAVATVIPPVVNRSTNR